MQSSQNVAIVKIPFRSRAMAFCNNRLLFLFPWERGFAIGNSGTQLAAVVLGSIDATPSLAYPDPLARAGPYRLQAIRPCAC